MMGYNGWLRIRVRIGASGPHIAKPTERGFGCIIRQSSYVSSTSSCMGIVIYRPLPPEISWPNRYPPTFSHSTFCRVMGNCLRSPLNAPSAVRTNARLSSSW